MTRRPRLIAAAVGLALAAAVSLGLARFSYALLLPPMRADLGWSYTLGGLMNTANAAGYLLGALAAPGVLARRDALQVLTIGGWAAALLLAAHGAVQDDAALLALRLATGVASAASFVSGGLLAARLASAAQSSRGASAGFPSPELLLGLYYGGTGVGIVVSALVVPPLAARVAPHAWQGAWVALGATSALATLVTALLARGPSFPTADAPAAAPSAAPRRLRWAPLGFGLAGYAMFGLGYIGYMTFAVTLLREQGVAEARVAAFYAVLGVGTMASPWLWSGLLRRARGGGALALLNALLAVATLLPVLPAPPNARAALVFASGLLFGAVFLSVVASTTALVRRNLPAADWPGGIAAFTVVFAAGQIAGPGLVGWVADGPGGLARGLTVSAAALACGALLAWRQRPLASAAP